MLGGSSQPADEFAEIDGEEFIPLLHKASQILGDFNKLLMLRVRNDDTARVLTEQLPRVRVFAKTGESRVADNNEPETSVDFTAQNADRLVETDTVMLSPADAMALPKGQCFGLLRGGQLYKLRLPLLGRDQRMSSSLKEIREERLARYAGLLG